MNINLEDKKVKYRDIKALNFSSIKKFDQDPMAFYKEFILGEKSEQKTSYSLTIGSLLDFYLLECRGNEQEFENSFHKHFALYAGEKGSGQSFLLADELFSITQKFCNEQGECIESFENRFKAAFNNLQNQGKFSKKTWEKGLEIFNNEVKGYYQSLIDNVGKQVVSLSDIEKTKQLGKSLMEDEFTKDIFNGNDDLEYLTKFVIEWKYQGFDMKSELDMLFLDHSKKQVFIKDLKTTYDNESFEYNYLKFSYYLQNAFYYKAVRWWLDNNNMEDYSIIEGMEFIVVDTSKNNRRPLRFKTDFPNLLEGLQGFTTSSGHKYKGIEQLVEEIKWANENQIWNISKENWENSGIIQLKTFGV